MVICRSVRNNILKKYGSFYLQSFLSQSLVNSKRSMCATNFKKKPTYFMKPEEPREEDCCNSGCHNCVLDVYAKKLLELNTNEFPSDSNLRFDLLSVTQFKPFVLTNIKKLNVNTNLYTFMPHSTEIISLSGYLPYHTGQHFALKVDKNVGSELYNNDSCDDKKGSHLIRDFTITSLSHKMSDCKFQVIIKLYDSSYTSRFIKTIKIGDITHWRGPYGDYKYTANKYKHLIMFCMGTGIAPMYPIVSEVIGNEGDETLLHLHFGCKTSAEIILRDEIRHLTSYWNFQCTYYLSKEKDLNNKKYSENFVLSRINADHIKVAVENKINFFILVCGNPRFNDDVKQALTDLNIPETCYHLF